MRTVALTLWGPPMFAKPNRMMVLAGFALVTVASCTGRDKPDDSPATAASPDTAPPTQRLVGPLSPADSQALATMNEKVKQYIDLHTKLEGSLQRLPDDATPQQIDKNQRAFEALMRKSR